MCRLGGGSRQVYISLDLIGIYYFGVFITLIYLFIFLEIYNKFLSFTRGGVVETGAECYDSIITWHSFLKLRIVVYRSYIYLYVLFIISIYYKYII